MNIEKEAQAFIANALPNGKCVTSVSWNGRAFVFPDGGTTLTQDMFDVWLKAKKHAEEMAKPTVRIKPKGDNAYRSSYPFVLSLCEDETFNGVLEDFRTTEEAKVWAGLNGYRVVE